MITTSRSFYIREDYTARLTPSYCDDTFVDRIYQPDVYTRAVQIMQETGATTLIDVGCGQGHKLVDLTCKVIGVDIGVNLKVCRAHMPQHEWIECDLETAFPKLPWQTLKKSVIVCADVIEHLIDPTQLLKGLAKASKYAQRIILSTPDRLVVYGHDHSGPPYNPGHVREWTQEEFVRLLEQYFTVLSVTHTNVDNVRGELQTLTVEVGAK
jgi:2-polyprenyl-3-methyl-5-hydroxy-6-metoxy-1,4-benzoquinol methylase